MTTNTGARRAHILLDEVTNGRVLERDEIEHLRSYLPAPPMQKTLQKIIAHVDDAWAGAGGNDWGGNSYDSEVTLEDWLLELHAQLQGLQDQQTAPEQAPALPEGMRLAEHEELGRVVVSPSKDRDGDYAVFYLHSEDAWGAYLRDVNSNDLTFIDAAPAKPAHPEFLETEADYRKAPEGTIVACEDSSPWYKSGSEWSSVDFCGTKDDKGMSRARRRVLRWGYGND